ncbi:MAG: hypothetical protein IPL28_03405 [Chloroflexi bacterium]|nr:hypothetical protein [Chloroflexota bacterium]
MLANISDKFHHELRSGEKIIWCGQPQQGPIVRPSDILMVPFTLLWFGFAIVLEFFYVSMGAPLFFMVWGGSFALIALWMIIARIHETIRLSKAYYALTNERAIFIYGVFLPITQSVYVKKQQDIILETYSNGKGTITFWSYWGGRHS